MRRSALHVHPSNSGGDLASDPSIPRERLARALSLHTMSNSSSPKEAKMSKRLSSFRRRPRPLFAALALLVAGCLIATAGAAGQAPTSAAAPGTVLQTNLVSDL